MLIIYSFILCSILLLNMALIAIQQEKDISLEQSNTYIPVYLVLTRWICNGVTTCHVLDLLPDRTMKHYNSLIVRAGMSPILKSCDVILLKIILCLFTLIVLAYLYSLIIIEYDIFLTISLFSILVTCYLPDIWLKHRIISRQQHFMKVFPFFLDLIVLSIKAGLTLSAAIDNAITKIPRGPLQTEFSQVLLDMRKGMSRRQSLESMAQRIKLSSVTNFVCVVNELEMTGGEMGMVLSIQAQHTRTERFLRAEKLANQAPVKMLLPLIGLLFPVTMLLILLPVYIRSKDGGVFNLLF